MTNGALPGGFAVRVVRFLGRNRGRRRSCSSPPSLWSGRHHQRSSQSSKVLLAGVACIGAGSRFHQTVAAPPPGCRRWCIGQLGMILKELGRLAPATGLAPPLARGPQLAGLWHLRKPARGLQHLHDLRRSRQGGARVAGQRHQHSAQGIRGQWLVQHSQSRQLSTNYSDRRSILSALVRSGFVALSMHADLKRTVHMSAGTPSKPLLISMISGYPPCLPLLLHPVSLRPQ